MGAPCILVPSREEARAFARAGGFGPHEIVNVGLGPVAAAVVATRAARGDPSSPRLVVLAGLAGTYVPDEVAVGTAFEPSTVGLDGVGVGEGPDARSATDLGWTLLPGAVSASADGVSEHLRLSTSNGPHLLTVCAASANPEHAALRRRRHPGAAAEDMEGFGVALACRLQGATLRIVRGVSNIAGDRDHGSWRVDAAIAAARARVLEILQHWEVDA